MADTRGDRVLLWVGRRFPSQARAIDWRVQDRRLARAERDRARVAEALRAELERREAR